MIYLDTSAVVPIFVTEPASDAVDAWVEACADPMVSSDWIVTEFASAISIKARRGEITTKQAQAAWHDFEAFCQTGLRPLPVSRSAFAQAAAMNRNAASGLRAGDSLHLAIAVEVGAKAIATADGALARNAQALGLAVSKF